MLSEKMQEALNAQLNAELYSSYLYLAMAAYFEASNLPGFGRWMKVQGREEMAHGMKFYEHINDRRGRVALRAVEAPPLEWKSPLAAFEDAYKHEQKVTGLIANLVKVAASENDVAAGIFLQWFVTEQVEEEKSADEVVQKLKRIGDSPQGLLLLDRELGQRQ
jgi:ferritin